MKKAEASTPICWPTLIAKRAGQPNVRRRCGRLADGIALAGPQAGAAARFLAQKIATATLAARDAIRRAPQACGCDWA